MNETIRVNGGDELASPTQLQVASLSANMTDVSSKVFDAIRAVVEQREVADVSITPASRLQEDLGFDSLELAELSATLEEDLGSDPYSQGETPQTVKELLAFYET